MDNKRYEFSTNNPSVSYAWTDGTPDSVRRLQNPAAILGENVTAYYIYRFRLYKITTSLGINATNRQSSTSIVEDETIEESGAFSSVAYGEKLSALNQYLVNFISGKSYFVSEKMSADTLKSVLNYIMKHLPSAITNDTIIDAHTMKFIHQPARLEDISYLNSQLMLPDFTTESYDGLYGCLSSLTQTHSMKHLWFISDMYMTNTTFLENRNLLDDYYYKLSLLALNQDQKDSLIQEVYLFVRNQTDFCKSVIFHELENYEAFIKNMDILKYYFPDTLIVQTCQKLLEKSLASQRNGSDYANLIVQSIDTLIAHHDKLPLADREQLLTINLHLTDYLNQSSAKRKLPPPTPEQLSITEYFLKALKDSHLKTNLSYATSQELHFIAEYCSVNHIEIKQLKNALKSDIPANADFVEYYTCLYLKQKDTVEYANDIPAELFVNRLISLNDFKICYGEKYFKKKWKEFDRKFVQQRYGKMNLVSMRLLWKLALSRRIYLWQEKERFLYLENFNPENAFSHSEKQGRKK